MQDEQMDHMDDLIREAAESHYPVYDDKAWDKMKVLLEEHLPLQKDRERFVIYFVLLLITGASLMIFYTGHKKEKVGRIDGKDKQANIPTSLLRKNLPIQSVDAVIPMNFAKNKKEDKLTAGDLNQHYISENIKAAALNRFRIKNVYSKADNDGDTRTVDTNKKTDLLLLAGNIDNDKTNAPVSAANHEKGLSPVLNSGLLKKDSAQLKIFASEVSRPAGIVSMTGKSAAKKAVKKGFASNFGISLAAGTDISFVNVKQIGQLRLNYGAGMSYTIAGRLTIGSGFYIAKKTYNTDGSGYHPPSMYWTNNINLQRVNADCNIYEIPSSVNYNFGRSKNHNWLAGIGFSTFLMKRETYDYLYKDAWGRAMSKSWTLRNGGNQYFSVLTLSGGYQYKVSRNISIIAAPYLKLPLRGIGFGKIQLNSGGFLLTAGIRPFAKR